MKTAIVLALSLTTAMSSQKPTVKTPTTDFEHKYFVQLDNANTALEDYTNMSCTAPDFADAETKLVKEYEELGTIESQIPKFQNTIVTAHEIEAFIGFVQIAGDSIKTQNKCIEDHFHDDSVPKIHITYEDTSYTKPKGEQ